MNFGFTSVAAPKAASSSANRYSTTARGAVSGLIASRSHSSFDVEFSLLASAWIRLASVAKFAPLTRPPAMQRATISSKIFRNRSVSRNRPPYGDACIAYRATHGGSSRTWSDLGSGQPDRGGKTNDTPDSGEPLRRAAVQSECREYSQRSACGSSILDRSRGDLSSCRTQPSGREHQRDRKSDQSNAADDLQGPEPRD